jgi:hypothetical protein
MNLHISTFIYRDHKPLLSFFFTYKTETVDVTDVIPAVSVVDACALVVVRRVGSCVVVVRLPRCFVQQE